MTTKSYLLCILIVTQVFVNCIATKEERTFDLKVKLTDEYGSSVNTRTRRELGRLRDINFDKELETELNKLGQGGTVQVEVKNKLFSADKMALSMILEDTTNTGLDVNQARHRIKNAIAKVAQSHGLRVKFKLSLLEPREAALQKCMDTALHGGCSEGAFGCFKPSSTEPLPAHLINFKNVDLELDTADSLGDRLRGQKPMGWRRPSSKGINRAISYVLDMQAAVVTGHSSTSVPRRTSASAFHPTRQTRDTTASDVASTSTGHDQVSHLSVDEPTVIVSEVTSTTPRQLIQKLTTSTPDIIIDSRTTQSTPWSA